MGKFRDGAPASSEAVTLILATIDRIKTILESLQTDQREPEGADGGEARHRHADPDGLHVLLAARKNRAQSSPRLG